MPASSDQKLLDLRRLLMAPTSIGLMPWFPAVAPAHTQSVSPNGERHGIVRKRVLADHVFCVGNQDSDSLALWLASILIDGGFETSRVRYAKDLLLDIFRVELLEVLVRVVQLHQDHPPPRRSISRLLPPTVCFCTPS